KSATTRSPRGRGGKAFALKRRSSPTLTSEREREESKPPVEGSRTSRTTPGEGSFAGSFGSWLSKKPLEETTTNSRPAREVPATTETAEGRPKSRPRSKVEDASRL